MRNIRENYHRSIKFILFDKKRNRANREEYLFPLFCLACQDIMWWFTAGSLFELGFYYLFTHAFKKRPNILAQKLIPAITRDLAQFIIYESYRPIFTENTGAFAHIFKKPSILFIRLLRPIRFMCHFSLLTWSRICFCGLCSALMYEYRSYLYNVLIFNFTIEAPFLQWAKRIILLKFLQKKRPIKDESFG